jgi:hypothetical protein
LVSLVLHVSWVLYSSRVFNMIFVVSRQCTLLRSKLAHAQSVCSLILSKIIQYSIECGWHWENVRSVKRETLKLIETFVDKAEDTELIAKQFVPAMMDPILGDYARNVSDARESEVLSLFATIINKLKGAMLEDVPQIFEAVFACTLEVC